MPQPKKKKAEERERDPSLVLFLALNMILLAFFILLVALSQPDKTKEAELAIEVRKAFQTFGGSFLGLGSNVTDKGISREKHALEDTEKVESMLGEIARFSEANKESKAFSYEITSEGLIVNISEAIAFPEGSTQLLESGIPFFDRIFNLILRTSNPVRIEGHSDDVELRTNQVLDNWELSAGRAVTVMKYFTASGEVPAMRFGVAGYASQHPIASNLTEEGRARNRRVTVVFLGKLKPVGE